MTAINLVGLVGFTTNLFFGKISSTNFSISNNGKEYLLLPNFYPSDMPTFFVLCMQYLILKIIF